MRMLSEQDYRRLQIRRERRGQRVVDVRCWVETDTVTGEDVAVFRMREFFIGEYEWEPRVLVVEQPLVQE